MQSIEVSIVLGGDLVATLSEFVSGSSVFCIKRQDGYQRLRLVWHCTRGGEAEIELRQRG